MSLYNICVLFSCVLFVVVNNEICCIGRDFFNFNCSVKELNLIYVIKCVLFKEYNWFNEDIELVYYGCFVEVFIENKFGNIFMF